MQAESDLSEKLAHMVLVFKVENLIVFHQIDLQKHILCVPNKLLSHLGRLFVGFKLRILLSCVQALLIRVNLGFDLARSDKFCQLYFDNLKRETKRRGNFTHVNHFVGLDVLLEG